MKAELRKIRRDLITLCYKGGGHLGGSLSIIEVLYLLYRDYANIHTNSIILSKGHAVPALYTILCHFGLLTKEQIDSYGTFGSQLIHHPSIIVKGIEYSSGALGNGLSVGVGMGLSNQLANDNSIVFVVIGDGELNEGTIWEALTLVPNLNLHNVIVFLDKNGLQASDKTGVIIDTEKLISGISGLGWKVQNIDGHDIEQIKNSIENAITSNEPNFVVLNTIKGKGVSFMENNVTWHHKKLTEDEYLLALKELK